MSIAQQNNEQIARLRSAIADAYTACNEKDATMPSAEIISGLADCIRSIQHGIPDGYIKPSGNSPTITSNGTHNVRQYENAVVNVPVPDGYINLADVIIHATKAKSGTYTGTGSTLDKISITVGFRPKIFFMQSANAVYNNSTGTPYSLLSAVTIYNDKNSALNRRSAFVLRGNSTDGYGRGGTSINANAFNATENGVQGVGTSVKANSGITFDWWAWG